MPTSLVAYMNTTNVATPLPKNESKLLAAELSHLSGMQVYPRSITATQRSVFFLGRQEETKCLGRLSNNSTPDGNFSDRAKPVTVGGMELTLNVYPATADSAAAIRRVLPFLVAKPLGLQKSVGCGDRLGLATPGHIRAIRRSSMSPILAQQSMRENARTGRTPQQVMDDAMWGVLQEGWREGFGADADHLKVTADVDLCAAAGYTFYTFDPGEYVDNSANTAALDLLQHMVKALPWQLLDSSPDDLHHRLADRPIDLGSFNLTISDEELLRAAAKYGRAVSHTVSMYRHLAQVMHSRPFEMEMSVDETETVTTLAEHIYIAHELKRLGVKWVSLAPRYFGTFEKGVDYIGDLSEFERSFARHLAVAKAYGPYKLSLHSGSDKFSIYPIAARVAGELVHLKTAGTSYLEALRAIAVLNPTLFREIVAFAIQRYATDRATYHVSADTSQMPDVATWPDDRLTTLLDNFHGREVLHVTFGSVLNRAPLCTPFFASLRSNETIYYRILEDHFKKHLAPFGESSAVGN